MILAAKLRMEVEVDARLWQGEASTLTANAATSSKDRRDEDENIFTKRTEDEGMEGERERVEKV